MGGEGAFQGVLRSLLNFLGCFAYVIILYLDMGEGLMPHLPEWVVHLVSPACGERRSKSSAMPWLAPSHLRSNAHAKAAGSGHNLSFAALRTAEEELQHARARLGAFR